jgi:hypothetical protein
MVSGLIDVVISFLKFFVLIHDMPLGEPCDTIWRITCVQLDLRMRGFGHKRTGMCICFVCVKMQWS